MAIALSSIGIKVSYAFETVAGTRPTTGYTHIEGIKEIPELSPAPDALETTTLDNLSHKSYIPGLQDTGGTINFLANFTQSLFDEWNGDGGVMEQYETNKSTNKAMWMCVDIPGITDACYLPVEPTKIGVPGVGVNEVLETNIYVTLTGDLAWDTKPTYADSV